MEQGYSAYLTRGNVISFSLRELIGPNQIFLKNALLFYVLRSGCLETLA